jgi:hypothetical protein
MVAEVFIHHCKLRIVRRDGWSWGPEPRRILQTAIRRLPELIARRLENLWPEGADFEIAAPVRISVPVRMSELLAAGESLTVELPAKDHPPHSALSARLEQAVKAAFEAVIPASHETGPAATLIIAPGAFDAAPGSFGETAFARPINMGSRNPSAESASLCGEAWLSLILSWREQGALAARLELLSPTMLETWHRKLLAFDNRQESESSPDSSPAVERLLTEIFDELSPVAKRRSAVSPQQSGAANSDSVMASERVAVLRRRILSLVELTARSNAMPGSRHVQEILDRAFPLGNASTVDQSNGIVNSAELVERIKKMPGAPSTIGQSNESHTTTEPFGRSEKEPGKHAELEALRIASICGSSATDRASVAPGRDEPEKPGKRVGPEALKIAFISGSSAMDRASVAPGSDEPDGKTTIPFQIVDAPAIRGSAARKTAEPLARRFDGLSPTRRFDGLSLSQLFEGEAYVHSALPFLLLRPLEQLGYFEALAATLESAELAGQAPLFASALAYKTLDAPERGWLRRTETLMASAVFAGLAAPVSDGALVEFARRISAHLSPLEATITGTLVEGHNSNQPLLLWRTDAVDGGGLLLVDLEGLFPIAWADELNGLLPAMCGCGRSLLLIPQTSADSALLKQLDGAGFSFITDAPPTRDENWRRLRGQSPGRWWTNVRTGSDSSLMRAAQQLAGAVEETEAMWKTLAVDRRSIPRAPDFSFERSLALAAAAGFGSIAWTLWREREPVVPLLAMERFRDLDARVRFSRDSIRVRLPLGRRFQDLHEHGLLDDVKNAPWFGGRTLQFSGG